MQDWMHYKEETVQKLTAEQIEKIVDRVVPLIAEPEDHSFFRGLLFIRLETCGSSSEAAYFIENLLNEASRA